MPFETDGDLDFLSKLSKFELETLVAALRNRVENFGESWHHLIMIDACNGNLRLHAILFLLSHLIFNILASSDTLEFIANSLPHILI